MKRIVNELKPYGAPRDYPEAFWWNIAIVERADDRTALCALLEEVARMTGIAYSDVLVDWKRYLLTSWEYHPAQLFRRPGMSLRYLFTFVYFAVFSTWFPARRDRTILVDDWVSDSFRKFYGDELIGGLRAREQLEATDVTRYVHIYLRDVVRLLVKWPRLWAYQRKAYSAEGVDLSHYLFVVLKNVLAGRSLRRRFRPAVVVSGNDNGFPLIKARAAGMRIVLMQNGIRPPIADAAFLCADRYIAMGDGKFDALRDAMGCRLGQVHPLGSPRLSHYLRKRRPELAPQYDIVFVSDLEDHDGEARYDAVFGHCYAMRFEREAIALINALAERTDASVAYYPRVDDDRELRALGLRSEHITYLERREGGVYAAADAARIVLSTVSTVGLEAMALDRTVGFVNLSGNRSLNMPFAADGLDYNGEDGSSLASFIAALEAKSVDRSEYIMQRYDFGEAAAAVVLAVIEETGRTRRHTS